MKTLADKAYPNLVDEAREQFALNQYLAQLSNPQVAFAVKQTKPQTVDDAVCATLEMESYSKPVPSVTPISEEVEEEAGAVAPTAVQGSSELKVILERMNQMETQLMEMRRPSTRDFSRGRGRMRGGRSGSWNCWNCGGRGHIARECPSAKVPRSSQANGQPPAV